MKNFYLSVSYNMSHLFIKELFDELGVLKLHDNIVELKVRSKHFLSMYEASLYAQEDFNKKLEILFPEADLSKIVDEDDSPIKVVTVMNPKYALHEQLGDLISQKFGEHHSRWDDNCCSTMFFCNVEEDEDTEDMPNDWMIKYEIFFEEDKMELLAKKNGEYIFQPDQIPYQSYTSTIQ